MLYLSKKSRMMGVLSWVHCTERDTVACYECLPRYVPYVHVVRGATTFSPSRGLPGLSLRVALVM